MLAWWQDAPRHDPRNTRRFSCPLDRVCPVSTESEIEPRPSAPLPGNTGGPGRRDAMPSAQTGGRSGQGRPWHGFCIRPRQRVAGGRVPQRRCAGGFGMMAGHRGGWPDASHHPSLASTVWASMPTRTRQQRPATQQPPTRTSVRPARFSRPRPKTGRAHSRDRDRSRFCPSFSPGVGYIVIPSGVWRVRHGRGWPDANR